ncbi:uncharacterized protein LOC143269162 isoform X2 [Peromyscus maniculatus bairdii]|uniref:uncharacterized protein LOC143269162 isoform X2 n=1 Tax=Peromyscus maniculatus bairdii TaxID=230844 RepID=UPI003FD243BE
MCPNTKMYTDQVFSGKNQVSRLAEKSSAATPKLATDTAHSGASSHDFFTYNLPCRSCFQGHVTHTQITVHSLGLEKVSWRLRECNDDRDLSRQTRRWQHCYKIRWLQTARQPSLREDKLCGNKPGSEGNGAACNPSCSGGLGNRLSEQGEKGRGKMTDLKDTLSSQDCYDQLPTSTLNPLAPADKPSLS